MDQLLSAGFDLETLGMNFDNKGFGPASSDYEFKDQFDGKLFKPYIKKERLGKMCDFAAMQAATYIPNKSVVQQQK